MLDLDGTVCQTLDLAERARHATISNHNSVGIEMANQGAHRDASDKTLAQWYAKEPAGRTRITKGLDLCRGMDGPCAFPLRTIVSRRWNLRFGRRRPTGLKRFPYQKLLLGESVSVPEKRLAPRRGIVRVSIAFRPEIRAVFVFNQTIIYYA
jgi:hypothetical protein